MDGPPAYGPQPTRIFIQNVPFDATSEVCLICLPRPFSFFGRYGAAARGASKHVSPRRADETARRTLTETETAVNMAFILLECAFAFRIRMPAPGGYRQHDDRRLPWRMEVLVN
jgi:hypothetical protein